MKRTKIVLMTVVMLLSIMVVTKAEPVGPQLQKISVNIYCPSTLGGSGSVQGSGTVIVTKVDDKSACWVITAHHVISDLREVRTVIDSDGDEKKQVRYRDAKVIQEQVQNGRVVGEVKFDAKVISVDSQRDIALLRVRKGDFSSVGAVFYLDKQIPQPGTEIYHCGAPGGKEIGGTCSLTVGIISRIGVRIPEFGGAEHGVFDQSDCAALGGSSGGLIALKHDGRWIGMITLGLSGSDSFHWVVPIRSVSDWVNEAKVEWLIDPSVKQPSEEDIKNIPLELNRPGFSKSGNKPTPAKPQERVREVL